MKPSVLFICILSTLSISACQHNPLDFQSSDSFQIVSNTYVSNDYHKRSQGYDWVAVETTQQADNALKVSIRSRADIKKPTCTFDGVAYPVNSGQYQINQGDMTLMLDINANGIDIKPKQDSDHNKALFYCSGGGSLIGSYQRVQNLDRAQLDNTKFMQNLSLQNISFFIKHVEDTLTVRSAGLAYEFNENYGLMDKMGAKNR